MQQPPNPPPGYMQYPQQPQAPYQNYQSSPYGQPPVPPRKPSGVARFIAFVRRHPILSGIIAAVLIVMIVVASIQNATSPQAAGDATPTAVVGTAQQSHPTPTQVPTQDPTKAPVSANITPTHGSPHLGGNVSDFYGKFGQPLNAPQSGSSPSNRPSWSVGWITDSNNGYLLSVQYYADTHLVYYLSYVGPSRWTKAQYRDYLINNFAPPGASPDTSLNQQWINGGGDPYNPIIYTSSVGNIALHISDGEADMNTL